MINPATTCVTMSTPYLPQFCLDIYFIFFSIPLKSNIDKTECGTTLMSLSLYVSHPDFMTLLPFASNYHLNVFIIDSIPLAVLSSPALHLDQKSNLSFFYIISFLFVYLLCNNIRHVFLYRAILFYFFAFVKNISNSSNISKSKAQFQTYV